MSECGTQFCLWLYLVKEFMIVSKGYFLFSCWHSSCKYDLWSYHHCVLSQVSLASVPPSPGTVATGQWVGGCENVRLWECEDVRMGGNHRNKSLNSSLCRVIEWGLSAARCSPIWLISAQRRRRWDKLFFCLSAGARWCCLKWRRWAPKCHK